MPLFLAAALPGGAAIVAAMLLLNVSVMFETALPEDQEEGQPDETAIQPCSAKRRGKAHVRRHRAPSSALEMRRKSGRRGSKRAKAPQFQCRRVEDKSASIPEEVREEEPEEEPEESPYIAFPSIDGLIEYFIGDGPVASESGAWGPDVMGDVYNLEDSAWHTLTIVA